MSTNLYYEPTRPRKPKVLGDGLKWAIREYYGSDERVFTRSDIGFIQGVKATTNSDDTKRDCATLIEAIEQHGEVSVWIAE